MVCTITAGGCGEFGRGIRDVEHSGAGTNVREGRLVTMSRRRSLLLSQHQLSFSRLPCVSLIAGSATRLPIALLAKSELESEPD